MGTVPKSTARRSLTRRAFLTSFGGGFFAVGGAGLYARYVEPYWAVVESEPMDLRNLHPSLVGLRVLQLSDLHLHGSAPAEYLRTQLQRCQALSPDLILLTGDYITRGDLRCLDELASLLRILSAPLGVFAVLGNHDCGAHHGDARLASLGLAQQMQNALSRCAITVLRNAAHTLTVGAAQLQLVGIDDLWSGFSDADRAFADVDPDVPCIALAHNPDAIDNLKDKPCDWILCGHTHGGQVRLPFIGAPFLPVRHREYDAGLFHVGEKRLYVNRGLGHLQPIRFNCRPEITLFTLTCRA